MKTLMMKLMENPTIYESLTRKLQDSYLYEMAIDRSKYEDEVKSTTKEIFTNIILVYIASHNNAYSHLLNHWKTELNTHMNHIADYTIKNDSALKRKKVIDAYWKKMDYDWRDLPIEHMTMNKMKAENISLDSKEYRDALAMLHNDIATSKLSNILTSNDPHIIQQYIDKL